jgi:hypothetical protein
MTEISNKKWNKQYEQLVEFKRKNGNCLVPKRYKQDPFLGQWVLTQRKLYSKNKLRPDRKELLDELGFVWRVGNYAPSWNTQYEKLVEFKQTNGHCLVPRTRMYQEDVSLGIWVSTQRQRHTNNKMPVDRKGLLDEIGFVWRVDNDTLWKKQYEKLVEFKQTNVHCLVPQRYQEDVAFGYWVNTQRQFHSNNKLGLDRTGLLDEIGFVWKVDTLAARSSTTKVSCR